MKRVAIVCDDVTGLFSIQKQKRIHQDFPLISLLEDQSREYGMCMWATTLEPSLVLSSVQNVNVRLMMSLSSGIDSYCMARSMGLDFEESIKAKNLEAGEAIVKIGTRPVGCILVQLTRSRVNRVVTVDQARQRSEGLRKKLLSKVKPRSKRLEAIIKDESGMKKSRQDGDWYLTKVEESQGLMISEIREKYKLTIQKEINLRKQNLDRGCIEEVEVEISAKGHNPKVLKMTKKGRDRIAALGKKPSHKCKGGPEHIFWQMRGKEYMERVMGYSGVVLERQMGRTTFDVFGKTAGHNTAAIEVAMSTGYELTKIKRSLGQVDRLIIACKSKIVMENLRRKVAREVGEEAVNKVEFRELKNLYLRRESNVRA